MTEYATAILTFACIYGFVALGLSLQWGMTGLINLGQVAFFAIGAYTAALLLRAGLPFAVALISAGLAGAASGAALAALTPRLREDYLAIVTLGFSEFVRLIFLNEKWIAGGPDGIAGIARPLAGLSLDPALAFLCLAILLIGAATLASALIQNSPFGRVLRGIREDETVAESVGKPTLSFKVQAFALGAALAAIGGALFGSYLTYISPDMFGANVSVFVLAAVLIARQGSIPGTLIGITAISILLEGTRLLQDYVTFVDGVQLAALRLIVLGLGLMLIVLLRFSKAESAR